MEYRKFGSLDWMVSALGFGCMRLPTTDGKPMSANVDRDETTRMIRYAIDQGVNYVDTAYPYHDGNSEAAVGMALRDGYRGKVRLATKSPTWLIKGGDDFDKYLDIQMKRLETDRIDMYLLHSLDKQSWRNVILKHGILKKCEQAKADGRIGFIGFSFHDDNRAFSEIVDGYDGWDFCQIQYNYMDIDQQAGTSGLRYAAAKGLAVVVMEPLLGGKLARPLGETAELIRSRTKRTPAGLALQFVWDHHETATLLSGMSTMAQVEENIIAAESSARDRLSPEEKQLIAKIREELGKKALIPCTGCGYCLPCPSGLEIPTNFELYNDGYVFDDASMSRALYSKILDEGERASKCTQCAECESKCPQKIPISQWMPKVHDVLGGKGRYTK